MSMFPKVQSPCPYKGSLSDIMDGSVCRLCKREVHDLSAMTAVERRALVAGCKTELCVSYRVAANSTLAALAIGATATAMPAAAQDDGADDIYIIVGGLRKPEQAQWLKDEPASKRAPLPVIYDDEDAAPKSDRQPAR